jgi:hypothetical protein
MNQIEAMRLLTLRSALQLEIRGLHRSRPPSAYVILKRDYGLKGSREKVLAQLDEIRKQLLCIE